MNKSPSLHQIAWAWVAIAALAMLLAGGPLSAQPSAPNSPNVVLILSDDHGWMDYGFMGHPDVHTPHLDGLAARSLTYTRGYVPSSVCRPSLAAIITGLHPHENGITGNDHPGDQSNMFDPDQRTAMVDVFKRNPTLPKLLGERGYLSHQSGKWWEGKPQESGFTHAMTHGDFFRPPNPARPGSRARHGDDGLPIGREGLKPIADFLDEAGGKPFLLWYAPFLPHTPHNPPERLLAKYQQPGRSEGLAKYYAMVEWMDETVGELLGLIEARGKTQDTLVVFVSDNGWIQPEGEQNQPQTRSKMSPFDAGMRTPILVSWPGQIQPARDDITLVSSVDIAPTVLHAAGLTPTAAMRGLDLRDRSALARRKTVSGALLTHTAVELTNPAANLKYRYTVREDGWKLILPHEPNRAARLDISGRTADWEQSGPMLFHVLNDPREEVDLAAQRPDLVRELTAATQAWWATP